MTVPTEIHSVTDKHREQYEAQGYCIVRNAVPAYLLALLDRQCLQAIENVHEEMDRLGVHVLGGSRRGRQYAPGGCRSRQPELDEFLFSAFLSDVRDRLLGPGSSLLWEQYAVKLGAAGPLADAGGYRQGDGNPQSLGRFSWHQDSGYLPFAHSPYLSCWVALDDASEANGALRVLPFDELGIRTRVAHLPDPENGDLVGYFGTLPGMLLPAGRGDMVCFSSTLFHRSARNDSVYDRRAYLAQYAPHDFPSAEGKFADGASDA